MIKDIQKSDLFDDVFIFTNSVFYDDRGEFIECYREKDFSSTFLQDNISISKKNTLRGLHFQFDPPQGKLVTVIKGSAIDIILDIKKNSDTFGKFVTVKLSEKNKKQVWIPPGYAHGFLALEDDTILFYKCTEYWNKLGEGSICPIDPQLGIDLNVENIVMSEKDKNAQSLSEYSDNPMFLCRGEK